MNTPTPPSAHLHSTASDLRVESGAIVALRLFDIAYAIDLPKAEALWASQARASSSRSQLISAPAKAVAFDVPPVLFTLEPLTLNIGGGVSVLAGVTARLYDFGVVTLALRVPASALAWTDFERLFNAIDSACSQAAANIWDSVLADVRMMFASALIKPSGSTMQEDYLLAVVHRWSEPLTALQLQDRLDLAPLLSGEKRPLSEGSRRDLLRQRFSYYEDDLVVITWDRAFIYEPRGDSDVADVIEVANAQLLELRYYDELLDDELPHMYDLVEETRRARSFIAPRRYAHLARRLYTLVAEVTEITEKVDNALQVTEDVYLARVYSAALELFRVPSVSAAVDRKLAIIRDTYTALYDEASGARGEFMELAIVVLIAVEILLVVLGH